MHGRMHEPIYSERAVRGDLAGPSSSWLSFFVYELLGKKIFIGLVPNDLEFKSPKMI